MGKQKENNWLIEQFKKNLDIDDSDPITVSAFDLIILERCEPFLNKLQKVLDKYSHLSETIKKRRGCFCQEIEKEFRPCITCINKEASAKLREFKE